MKKANTLEDLYQTELKDLYDAEKQLVKMLPKIADEVTEQPLREALLQHWEQTKGHMQRLEKVFEMLGVEAEARKCKGLRGILDEGKELMGDTGDMTSDAGIIASAQKVEHYEIAGYGSVVSWARRLGHQNQAELLAQTLAEEKQADQTLTRLAESSANPQAQQGMERAA